MLRVVFSFLALARQACALPTEQHDISLAQFPRRLAGCNSGNFEYKGAATCAGIAGLQCKANGQCEGTMQNQAFKINCNRKNECITQSWGGTMVRKSVSNVNRDGSVSWSNGCTWICQKEDEGTPQKCMYNAGTEIKDVNSIDVCTPAKPICRDGECDLAKKSNAVCKHVDESKIGIVSTHGTRTDEEFDLTAGDFKGMGLDSMVIYYYAFDWCQLKVELAEEAWHDIRREHLLQPDHVQDKEPKYADSCGFEGTLTKCPDLWLSASNPKKEFQSGFWMLPTTETGQWRFPVGTDCLTFGEKFIETVEGGTYLSEFIKKLQVFLNPKQKQNLALHVMACRVGPNVDLC